MNEDKFNLKITNIKSKHCIHWKTDVLEIHYFLNNIENTIVFPFTPCKIFISNSSYDIHKINSIYAFPEINEVQIYKFLGILKYHKTFFVNKKDIADFIIQLRSQIFEIYNTINNIDHNLKYINNGVLEI